MTGIRGILGERLRLTDDEALAALASRGLLRRARKDLEKATPSITSETADALVVEASGHAVRFDARGVAHATCGCGASGACHHVLAAAIWLRDGAAVQTDPAADPMAAARAELLALGTEDFVRHAGRAGHRWAWELAAEIEPETGVVAGGERQPAWSIASPRMAFRYLGGGLDGVLVEGVVAKPERWRVAGVLAYQRALGREPEPPPAGSPRASTAPLDLGHEHSPVPDAAASREGSRERLHEATSQILVECMELGLAHLSPAVAERLATLAAWASGAESHRLASLLRRLSDHVDLLLARAAGADEQALLEEMAIAHALASALRRAAREGAEPARLLGRARRRYDEAQRLELAGLGALPWSSASGWHGLTLIFWSVTDGSFLTCTDARPIGQAGFEPRTRHALPGPWSGLTSPAAAAGRRVVVAGASTAASGRISASERATAVVAPADAAAFRAALPVETSWSELARRRAGARHSALEEPDPAQDWAVLEPARFGAPRFDVHRQTLAWPLFDGEDARLDAEIAHAPLARHAIARIEALVAGDPPPGTLVVARLRASARGLVAEPVSLVTPDGRVDALHFDGAAHAGEERAAAPRGAARAGAGATATQAPAAASVAALPRVLADMRAVLGRMAERGIPPERAPLARAECDAWSARAEAQGLTSFARLRRDGSAAELALRMAYVLLQHERLAGGVPDPERDGATEGEPDEADE